MATLELPASTSVPAALREASAMMGIADDESASLTLPEVAARLLQQRPVDVRAQREQPDRVPVHLRDERRVGLV